MEILHGSESIIEKPIYGFGNPNNDYGLGFYCSQSLARAEEWACQDERRGIGYVNQYELNIEDLNVLYINKTHSILAWIATLISFRVDSQMTQLISERRDLLISKFAIDVSGYDAIIGFRADDSYFAYAKNFLQGAISLEGVEHAVQLGNLGEQICLLSEKAFLSVRSKDKPVIYTKESYIACYNRFKQNDAKAREDYRNMKAHYSIEGTFILDILRGSM